MVHTHLLTDKFQVIASNPYIPLYGSHTHKFMENLQVIAASNPYIPLYSKNTPIHGKIPANSVLPHNPLYGSYTSIY